MRQRRWSRLFALLAVLGLVLAACSTEDDDPDTSGGDDGGGEESSAPATCQGEVGAEPSIEPVGGSDADGTGLSIGMALDIGGIDDDSFNEAANTGLEAAATDMGVETQLLEPNEDGSNRAELLRQLAEGDHDLVIAVGFAFAESLGGTEEEPGGLAAEFPDVNFAIIDSLVDQPNVTSLLFAEEQGSFLVGAAAALASGTGKVGYIGGVETELIQKFQAGYEAGVAEIDPDVEVESQYITQPPNFDGFADPTTAREIADGMYSDEVDVIYHAAGGSGAGLFASAQENDRLAIGVDSNQYQAQDEATQPCILTSMIKRVDTAVYTAIESLANDELEGGEVTFDLANDGIGYSLDGGQLDDVTDQLDDLRQQIIDGDIEVPTTP